MAIALEDLRGRGLARPVWTEQAEDLAGVHREVHAAHGLQLAIALAKICNLDGKHERGR